MLMRKAHRRTLIVLALLAAGSGCASAPADPAEADPDPLEKVNRVTYTVNDTLDRFLLRPVAKGYQVVLPKPVRNSVSNFFDNLGSPVVIANDLLQAKFRQALADTGRFLLNSTVGIGGLFDPAARSGLEAHDEDFGQTLAVWGVPSGPYLVLPLVGPSTVRDAIGRAPDTALDPLAPEDSSVLSYDDSSVRDKLLLLSVIDGRHRLLDLDQTIREAYDPYGFVREAYLQRRNYLIHDGNPPQDDLYEDFEEFEDFEEPVDEAE